MIQCESKSETVAAFTVNTSKTIEVSNHPICKHYGKVGHEEENCFELIGYLVGWSTRRNGRGRGRSQCAHDGHGGSRHGRGGAVAYAAQAVVGKPRQLEGEARHPMSPGLSSDQVEKLLSLIDVPKEACEKLSGKGD